MKTRSVTVTSHYLTDDEGREFELEHEPCEWIDPNIREEGGDILITYAVHDHYAYTDNPLDEDRGATFQEFTTQWDRDAYAEEQLDQGRHVYLVDHYEHSMSRYTVIGKFRGNEGHRGIDYWDSRPSGILSLDNEWTNPDEIAPGLMEEYTSWVNGDVYGIVTERFTLAGDEWEQAEEDSVWGFIGTDYAQQVVNEGGY